MSPNRSDQMSQRSQVSRIALWWSSLNVFVSVTVFVFVFVIVFFFGQVMSVDTDVSSPKYAICKSWNSLPFDIKSTQPDEFLDTLRKYFNFCNEKICQIENCWLCGS